MVKEKNKIYTIIKVVSGENQYQDEFDLLVSPVLIENRDKLLAEYILKLLNKFKNELAGLNKAAELNEKQIQTCSDIVDKLEKLYEIAKDY